MLWSFDTDSVYLGLGPEYLHAMESEDRRGMIDGVLGPELREHIVARHAALRRVPTPAFMEELAAAALARYPDDPEMAQIPAQTALYAGSTGRRRATSSPPSTPPRSATPRRSTTITSSAWPCS